MTEGCHDHIPPGRDAKKKEEGGRGGLFKRGCVRGKYFYMVLSVSLRG